MKIYSELQQLTQVMQEIVDAIMKSSQTDFTIHDIKCLQESTPIQPFFWLVRAHGTHFARKDNEATVKWLHDRMYFQIRNQDDFILYHYEDNVLQPILPLEFIKWAMEKYNIMPMERSEYKISPIPGDSNTIYFFRKECFDILEEEIKKIEDYPNSYQMGRFMNLSLEHKNLPISSLVVTTYQSIIQFFKLENVKEIYPIGRRIGDALHDLYECLRYDREDGYTPRTQRHIELTKRYRNQ